MTNQLLDFAATNPMLTFFLAWPVALIIVSLSWLMAANIEAALNLILRLANLATVWFRGYPPSQIAIPNVDPSSEEK